MLKYNFNEVINFILLLGLGAFTFARGFFFTKEQEKVLGDSDFYVALHHIMPIWVWGIIIMIASLILMIGAFFLPRQSTSSICNYLLVIGGFSCSILYFLMTSASIYHAINWLSTTQFSILSAACFVVGFIGGADIYDRK
ncbi:MULTISPECIES: hypothetical protein [Bacillales]|uniref:hypothetical protein n=1 Tax=Bacillales TaxID=1385 RepID=UPI00054CBF8E